LKPQRVSLTHTGSRILRHAAPGVFARRTSLPTDDPGDPDSAWGRQGKAALHPYRSGSKRAREGPQAGHRQQNEPGSCASPCPYGGYLCRHPGGLPSSLAALSVVDRDAFFRFAHIILRPWTFCPDSVGPSRRSRSYLRAAQAYILISMPTCASTIFGFFQAIRDSQVSSTIAAVKYGQATPKAAGAMPFDRLLSSVGGRRPGIIRRHSPNGVSNVVGDQQSAGPIDCQSNRSSSRVIVRIEGCYRGQLASRYL
jgi:hypothetical protein